MTPMGRPPTGGPPTGAPPPMRPQMSMGPPPGMMQGKLKEKITPKNIFFGSSKRSSLTIQNFQFGAGMPPPGMGRGMPPMRPPPGGHGPAF